jgi:hypothetical protein
MTVRQDLETALEGGTPERTPLYFSEDLPKNWKAAIPVILKIIKSSQLASHRQRFTSTKP